MSATRLHVLVGDEVAGTLTRAGRGLLKFRYDETYASRIGSTSGTRLAAPAISPRTVSISAGCPTATTSSL